MLLRTQLQEDLYHGCISLDFQTQQLAQEKLSAVCTSTEFLSRSQAGADAWIWLSYSLQTLLLFLKLLSSPKIIHIVSSKCLCAPQKKKKITHTVPTSLKLKALTLLCEKEYFVPTFPDYILMSFRLGINIWESESPNWVVGHKSVNLGLNDTVTPQEIA